MLWQVHDDRSGCDSGVPVGGGMSLDKAVIGVSLLSDRPDPQTRTPTAWNVEVGNGSGLDLTMALYIICRP